MGKTVGGVRTYGWRDITFQKRAAEVQRLRASGRYSSVEMSDKGGYVAIEVSTRAHKAEEIEAARILADKGYKVILKDEAGDESTVDGYVFALSYEQRTPTGSGRWNCGNALAHARSKRADVALIYDKYHKYHKETVRQGIIDYERLYPDWRFRFILVISSEGAVHRWKHDG